jgi:hypothetical protein
MTTKTATPEGDDVVLTASASPAAIDELDVIAEASAEVESSLSPEDFRELQRLSDHVASAPNNERYRQEMLALSRRLGLTHD